MVLYKSLGRESSREVVERAVSEIADRLSRMEMAVGDGDWVQVDKLASSLTGISAQVGLLALSDVANHLCDCIRVGDHTAIHAVAARLVRMGESSLFVPSEMMDVT